MELRVLRRPCHQRRDDPAKLQMEDRAVCVRLVGIVAAEVRAPVAAVHANSEKVHRVGGRHDGVDDRRDAELGTGLRRLVPHRPGHVDARVLREDQHARVLVGERVRARGDVEVPVQALVRVVVDEVPVVDVQPGQHAGAGADAKKGPEPMQPPLRDDQVRDEVRLHHRQRERQEDPERPVVVEPDHHDEQDHEERGGASGEQRDARRELRRVQAVVLRRLRLLLAVLCQALGAHQEDAVPHRQLVALLPDEGPRLFEHRGDVVAAGA
mmetsp:Transcript_107408/g.346631  ORF Transcript_107408/g.346631 Transcript_107408/m.346631 type:complete len:268 (+) Transcript_107408:456-1259(+)